MGVFKTLTQKADKIAVKALADFEKVKVDLDRAIELLKADITKHTAKAEEHKAAAVQATETAERHVRVSNRLTDLLS